MIIIFPIPYAYDGLSFKVLSQRPSINSAVNSVHIFDEVPELTELETYTLNVIEISVASPVGIAEAFIAPVLLFNVNPEGRTDFEL